MTAPKISFLAFFLLWAEYQGWKVPDFHGLVCVYLENFYLKGRTGLLMLPRGHSKSTILDIFNAWVIYCWPFTQILHQGTTDEDAYKCSNGTKDVLEKHPLCLCNLEVKRKKGEIERWWVAGTQDVRYGTMLAKGILSGVTGHRAHFIQNDDVETPKTTSNPKQRESLVQKLSEQTHIAYPNAKKLWIGTPHSYDSLYEKIKKLKKLDILVLKMFEHEKRFESAKAGLKYFLDFEPIHAFAGIGTGSKYLIKDQDYLCTKMGNAYQVTLTNDHHIVDFYSESIWSERFDAEEMTNRREECKTLNEWDSQYQMHAKPVGDVRLDPDKLIAYDVEPTLKRANGQYYLMLGERRIVGITCRWDPASGNKKSDASSVALVLHDDIGNKYWHRSIELTGEVVKHDDDGGAIIGGQVWQLCDLIEQFYIPKIVIEKNGVGEFAPASLKGALKVRRIRCGVEPKPSTKNKNMRILDALEGPLVSGLMWAHVSVLDSEHGENTSRQYLQMQQFNPAITEQDDDHLDSLAGAIVESPERIGKLHRTNIPKAGVNWREDSGSVEAVLEFEH